MKRFISLLVSASILLLAGCQNVAPSTGAKTETSPSTTTMNIQGYSTTASGGDSGTIVMTKQ